MATAERTAAVRRGDAAARGVAVGLGVVVLAAWAVTVWQWYASDRLMAAGVPMSLDMGGDASPSSAALFLALWLPMTAAMMLPSAWLVIARRESRAAIVRFVAQYLAVWEAVGVLVFALSLAVGRAFAASAWLMDHEGVMRGALLACAAAYLFSPIRRNALSSCRDQARRFDSGIVYGATCVRASAGWILALLALGAMDPRWIAAAAVLIAAERLAPALRFGRGENG